MKLDVRSNKLINDIMTNNNSCVLLISQPGSGKSDLLTELSSRYKTVFWFDGQSLNMSIFINYLIDQVIIDAKERSRFNQFIYCKSVYNGDSVIITAILDYISRLKGDCLMVFERMEDLRQGFDLSLIERLIKHCPSNLKIIISSDKYIDLDYTKFEPNYPKIIDEYDLDRSQDGGFAEYLDGLSEKEVALLVYLSDLKTINPSFVDTIYEGGSTLIKYLTRKDYYIVSRGDNVFRFNKLFKAHLHTLKPQYEQMMTEMFKQDIMRLYADFLLEIGDCLEAFESYYKLKDYDKLDKTVVKALQSDTYLLRGTDFALSNCHLEFDFIPDMPFYSLFYAIVLEGRGKDEEAMELYNTLAATFRSMREVYPEIICLKRSYTLCAKYEKDDETLKHNIIRCIMRYNEDYPEFTSLLFAAIIEYRKELNKSLYEVERDLLIYYTDKNTLYVKCMEILANTYFDLGNYKRAYEIAHKLKEYVPFYIIPHNFLAFIYYSGEVDKAEKMAKQALGFALDNDITKDISMLYSALAMVDLYYDRIDDANKKYDKAVRMDDGDFAKFYNIGLRCIFYSKYRDPAYAKEVALIYLKYCENFKPKYKNIMQLALSFAYLKLKDNQRAYDFATKCVQNSKSRTTNWFLGMAIATNYMLAKGDLKDATTLVSKLFKAAADCGLDMLLVDFYNDIFTGIVKFAKENDIEVEYIEKIETILNRKTSNKCIEGRLRVTMFGDVCVFANDSLIKWKTKKSKELFLHYLLAGEKGIDRSIILNHMWKDYVYNSAINNLKTTNTSIRNTLSQYNIKFSMQYVNSKYILKIDNVDNNYFDYLKIKEEYHEDMPLASRVKIMNAMLKLYTADFATDMNYPMFIDERKSLKQEIIIYLLKLIRYLAKQGDYLEAKRFYNILDELDKGNNNYSALAQELDLHLNLTK